MQKYGVHKYESPESFYTAHIISTTGCRQILDTAMTRPIFTSPLLLLLNYLSLQAQ